LLRISNIWITNHVPAVSDPLFATKKTSVAEQGTAPGEPAFTNHNSQREDLKEKSIDTAALGIA
jgi:hypothetical protein